MLEKSLGREIKQKRPFRAAEEEAYLNIIKTANELSSAFFRFLKPFGISLVQYNILRILGGAGADGLPGVEIANRLVTKVPDITRLIDRLEKMSFVRRVRSSSDRRVIFIQITEKGIRALKEMDAPTLELLKRMLGHLSSEELTMVSKLMVKARKALRNGTMK